MSTYARITIFGFERMVDSDGYPETIVPQLLDVLDRIKTFMKKNKLKLEDATCLALRNTDYFFDGYCDKSDYNYIVSDFKTIYINNKPFSIKRLHKYTEDDYEKLKEKLNKESEVNYDY